MGFLRRRRGATGPVDVRDILRDVGRRNEELRWLRRLDEAALQGLVERIERDLGEHATRDALLEHAARLHYDAAARAEARARRAEPPRADLEDARERTIASIFERRYGVPLVDALEVGLPIPVEPEEGHLRVERTLLRAGLALAVVDDGHWLYETASTVVYLRHYARERALDLYAPVHEFSGTDPRSQDAVEGYLRANGGSIGGAFWGICTFERAGDHVCACARLSTAELTVPAVRYAVESVLHLISTVESS
jgi:hypothetical protein